MDTHIHDHVRLNPKYYDIKEYRTFNMSNITQETANIIDPSADVDVVDMHNMQRNCNINHKCRTKLYNPNGVSTQDGAPGVNPRESWQGVIDTDVGLQPAR
jgi:hypothetical protein